MSVLRNPALLLAWGLPMVAVAASVLTLVITIRNPDAQLPEQYHWEGFQLDRDFSKAARAAELRVDATVTGFGTSGHCEVVLRMVGAPPNALVLRVAHATRPALDQHVKLQRLRIESVASGGHAVFAGKCRQAPEGSWRLELIDTANDWSVRRTTRGSLDRVTMVARGKRSE